MIELQQPINPLVVTTPEENLRYCHTGVHELGFQVDDIDSWFERIKKAGYRHSRTPGWSVPALWPERC
ncbi:hypothetical protein [Pseudonocardia xishanensis]|uniref:VOC domain-containing protein n=1 Tax=Pseudonocardia xishanensis TaxID=630995 RepID=A0ABP8RYZ0_9PSEU